MLREMTQQDYTEVITQWNNNIGPLFPMDQRLFEQNMKNEKNRMKALIAHEEGEPAGFIIYKQWTAPLGSIPADNTIGYINSIIVDLKSRGRGIGKAMLAKVI